MMSTASALVDQAFSRLAELPGFVERENQRHLAHLLCDLIEGSNTGIFEAPTGLGKSLAALIPAIAQGIVNGKRVAIATYTNVLAEQYWNKDLPLALSLFDVPETYKPQFLIGRQRYACLSAIAEHEPYLLAKWHPELGIESEFRESSQIPFRKLIQVWQQISTPPICPGRFCHDYDACYYYSARKAAQKSPLIITNHSVVLQHSIGEISAPDAVGMLGELDFVILDEAHDLMQAAGSALEFELGPAKLTAMGAIASRLEKHLSERMPDAAARLTGAYKKGLDRCLTMLANVGMSLQEGILALTPAELVEHPAVKSMMRSDEGGKLVAHEVADLTRRYTDLIQEAMMQAHDSRPDGFARFQENAQIYLRYLDDAAVNCAQLFALPGSAVTHFKFQREPILRSDVVDVAPPLTELIWQNTPSASMSATLALDGNFEYFCRTTGASPEFSEVLPSPFDFMTQATAYLPPEGRIPDPGQARKSGTEEEYFDAIASEITRIIETLEGRTLALFHSRREMESVAARMPVDERLPILVQPKSGASAWGKRFLEDVHTSLFALRSFWTGFDAPGETLSCVVLVRVPFEVPFEPVAITRMALLSAQGLDPFQSHTLPQAKMMMRQGAGRLIRRAEDRGIIALLDPRLRTKAYGEEILANLPSDMRVFHDFLDAAGWLGLGSTVPFS